jgi:hypothetical protein
MSRWKIKASTLFILSIVFFLMLLIVVLPDVDLPDTAFHGGTAPVLVHARATSAPAAVTVAAVFSLPASAQISPRPRDQEVFAINTEPNFRPILLRSIRR